METDLFMDTYIHIQKVVLWHFKLIFIDSKNTLVNVYFDKLLNLKMQRDEFLKSESAKRIKAMNDKIQDS
jgi:hypothetical protein